MTIDELDTNAINIDEATECLFATGAFEDIDEAKNAVNSALELMEELKWYREQNLIRREDAWEKRPEWLNEDMYDINKSKENKGWNKCNNYWCEIIKQIPKAEYRGDEQ